MKETLKQKSIRLAKEHRPAFEQEIARLNADPTTNDALIAHLRESGQVTD